MEQISKHPKDEKVEEITILDRAPTDAIKLTDMHLEEIATLSNSETLKVFSDYVTKSFLEQFGVKVEVVFTKELNPAGESIIEAHLKASDLPQGVKLEDLRLFKISKDTDIHDGHYYISYDTTRLDNFDDVYADAIWFGAQNIEYEHQSKWSGKKVKLEVQKALRYNLRQSQGINRWEIEIPQKDMKSKSYLDIFTNPDVDNVSENICRQIVKKAGAYVIEQLKIRQEEI